MSLLFFAYLKHSESPIFELCQKLVVNINFFSLSEFGDIKL